MKTNFVYDRPMKPFKRRVLDILDLTDTCLSREPVVNLLFIVSLEKHLKIALKSLLIRKYNY